jgi:hypothetical protein
MFLAKCYGKKYTLAMGFNSSIFHEAGLISQFRKARNMCRDKDSFTLLSKLSKKKSVIVLAYSSSTNVGGSSATTMFGSVMSALATATRCC